MCKLPTESKGERSAGQEWEEQEKHTDDVRSGTSVYMKCCATSNKRLITKGIALDARVFMITLRILLGFGSFACFCAGLRGVSDVPFMFSRICV